ncbi:DUF3533 domain-containing protein [Streptomyces sp. NPDC048438]|uniref:DUF3533 domain-containing protein n=1 Tax=Streptomyces sp. NPDC048438 TaxID=3365551 RepID=UPI003716A6BB
MPSNFSSNHPVATTAARVLRAPQVWLVPAGLLTVALGLITLLFNGSVANPSADLRDAPVGLVSLDKGVSTGEGQGQNMGRQVVAGIAAQPQKPHQSIEWKTFSSLDAVERAIGRNELFAAVVLPQDYSTKMLSLAGTHPQKPMVTILTNHGAGSMAASIGQQVAESAARGASSGAATGILQQAQAAGAPVSAANQALLKDPVTVTAQAGAPLGDRTGQGMTAFFYALLLMMAGFLGANLINAMTDSALGYSANELGPKRHLTPPQHINRRQTLLAKYLIMVGASAVMSAAILAVSTFALHLDLPHSLLLWLFGTAAASAVGIGTLTVLAALGGPGIIVAMIFFISAAIPTSGGAIPLQAMPPFWQFLAQFEPQRAISDGVRAIMYFDAQAAAGLDRAWITLGAGLLASLAIGFAVTWLYDRQGWHRIHPATLTRLRQFLHHSDNTAHADGSPSA